MICKIVGKCNGLPENLRKNKELPVSAETGIVVRCYISLLYLLW